MKIKNIRLVNFGALIAHEEEKETNKNSTTGYFLYSSKIKFLNNSDIIIGKTGLKFGIEYFIVGDELYDPTVNFICKILHPILTNPISKENVYEIVEIKSGFLNEINFDYYSFEFDWEVQKGMWIFQIIENEKVLLEKAIEIK